MVNLVDKVQTFLAEPSEFFGEVREKSLWKAVLVYFLAGIVSLLAGYLSNFISVLLMPKMFSNLFPVLYGVIGIIFLIIGFGLFFIFGAIVHFFSKVIFRGEGNYNDTMKVLFYGSVPIVLLSFTAVSILFVVYSFILVTIGLSVYHNIRKSKAFSSAFIPFLLIIGGFISYLVYLFLHYKIPIFSLPI